MRRKMRPFQELNRLLKSYPVTSNAFLYAGYGGAGAVSVQVAKQWSSGLTRLDQEAITNSATKVNSSKAYYCLSMGGFNFDMAHIAGMVAFSFFYNGPANALIYPWYARIFAGRTNLCIFLDQTLYMPLCVIPPCWYINGIVKRWLMRDPGEDAQRKPESQSQAVSPMAEQTFWCALTAKSFWCAMEATTVDLKATWLQTVLWTWCIWVPAESLNMRFTPVHLRSPVAGLTSFIYLTGLAVWTHVL